MTPDNQHPVERAGLFLVTDLYDDHAVIQNLRSGRRHAYFYDDPDLEPASRDFLNRLCAETSDKITYHENSAQSFKKSLKIYVSAKELLGDNKDETDM